MTAAAGGERESGERGRRRRCGCWRLRHDARAAARHRRGSPAADAAVAPAPAPVRGSGTLVPAGSRRSSRRSSAARCRWRAARRRRVDAPPLEGMIFAVAAASIHSCVPSCAVHFGRTASDEVWDGWEAPSLLLLRDVAEEEELTIAYVDAEAPLRERTAALAALHGFRCRCERCGVQRGVSRTARKLREEGASERSLDELGALGLRALDAGLFDDALKALRLLLDSDSGKARRGATPPRRRDRSGSAGRCSGSTASTSARAAWLDGADAFGFHAELQREAATARVRDCAERCGRRRGGGGGGRGGASCACAARACLCSTAHERGRLRDARRTRRRVVAGRRNATPPSQRPTCLCTPSTACSALSTTRAHRASSPSSSGSMARASGATAARLRVSEAFVVRATRRPSGRCPRVQRDDSHLSLTIALNDASEYEGGGTAFEDVDGASPSRPIVASPQLGARRRLPGRPPPRRRARQRGVTATSSPPSSAGGGGGGVGAARARRGTKRGRGAAEASGGDAGGGEGGGLRGGAVRARRKLERCRAPSDRRRCRGAMGLRRARADPGGH